MLVYFTFYKFCIFFSVNKLYIQILSIFISYFSKIIYKQLMDFVSERYEDLNA